MSSRATVRVALCVALIGLGAKAGWAKPAGGEGADAPPPLNDAEEEAPMPAPAPPARVAPAPVPAAPPPAAEAPAPSTSLSGGPATGVPHTSSPASGSETAAPSLPPPAWQSTELEPDPDTGETTTRRSYRLRGPDYIEDVEEVRRRRPLYRILVSDEPQGPRGYVQVLLGGAIYGDPYHAQVSTASAFGAAIGLEFAKQFLGVELRYVGSVAAYRNAPADLYGNAVLGLFKLNFANRSVRPYAIGGVGYLDLSSSLAGGQNLWVPGYTPDGKPIKGYRPGGAMISGDGRIVAVGGGLRFHPVPDVSFGVEALYIFTTDGLGDDVRTKDFGLWNINGVLGLHFGGGR